MNPLIHFPAHLITGNHLETESQIIKWLQEAIPHNHNESECSVCDAIQEKNFYAFSWITPENRYTLETIDPIFNRITLQLAPGQHYFFIITRAELLTQACANTLLKLVEEPPAGYHFIFSAPHKNLILPTILSRCVETSCKTSYKEDGIVHPLVAQGYSTEDDWNIVHKEIAQYALNEHQTLSLFEALFITLKELYKKKLVSADTTSFSLTTIEKLLHFCKTTLEKPLQPGSSKILWKDFFMYKTVCLLEKNSAF